MDNNNQISALQLIVRSQDAALLEELLSALELNPAIYNDVEADKAEILIFAEAISELENIEAQINSNLPDWKVLFSSDFFEMQLVKIRQEDWSENWKKHFHCFKISDRLVLKPSWESYDAQAGEIILELDPGMCFGTGYHGTSRACLQFMDTLQQELGTGFSFLDAGCGSGILSLAAEKLGFKPIFAFDHDLAAVQTTIENLNKAGIFDIEVKESELSEYSPPQKCRVVVANILATVLFAEAEKIISFLIADNELSYLILSGILNEQYAEIKEKYSALGLEESAKITHQEWTSGLFHYQKK